jgi:3-phenylpropionate/cinnamic acid dioxygenase small subunit
MADRDERAADHIEIESLLFCYAERIDAGDFAGVAALFAYAEIKAPGQERGATGAAEVQALYESTTRRYEDGTPRTKHVTGNLQVTFEGPDAAAGRSYFTVLQALPDFPLQTIIAGRYHDRFERVAGRWRFCERLMLPELFGDLSRHLLIELKP